MEFPAFYLEDKVVPQAGGNDAGSELVAREPTRQGRTAKKPAHFWDYNELKNKYID